ncbi:MAG: hypothetical protein ACE5D0_06395 [Fidelibacterota bacterium]
MITLENLLHDNTRGATSIFKDSLKLFLSENDPGTVRYGVEKLKKQFPMMGLFVNLWTQIKAKDTIEEIHTILDNLSKYLKSSFNQVIENAGNPLPNECRIMTISHSSYVRELIINYKEKISIVYCLESAPEFEGKALVNNLLKCGFSADVVPDTGYHSQLNNSTHIITGSDLISEKFFINKSGTKSLVEMAIKHGKKVWILGDTLRFVPYYIPEKIPNTFEIIEMREEIRIFH